jgi:hypothetical protein
MNRYTSIDTLGRPVNIYWPWGMDLKWAVTIAPEEGLDYSLSGKEITLRVQKKTDATGVYLLDQDTTDGNITVDELTISINIPAADIVAAGIEEGGEYDFSLTIGEPIDGNRIQADFFAVQETGFVPAGCGSYEIGLAEVNLTVEVIGGPAGVDGIPGPAGPWNTTSRLVTASGPILATNTLVIAQASGNDIELSCPDPADMWDGTNGRVIVVARKWDDTGTVTITGDADGLPVELFSSPENGGESIWITTYDGVTLVVGDAPFVIQTIGGDYTGNLSISGSIQYADDTRPASEELRGTKRYVEGENFSREEMVMKVGPDQWDWVTTLEQIF